MSGSAVSADGYGPLASLAVVPWDESAFADVAEALGGLATWIAVLEAPPGATRTPGDVRAVGRAARARYVLHGWSESERGRTRLTLALTEAESGRALWQRRVERAEDERVSPAEAIGQAVPALLLERELDRVALAPPEGLTAHDLALRAYVAIMQPQRETFEAAATVLAEAASRPGPWASTRFAMVWWELVAMSQGWGGDAGTAAEAAAGLEDDDPAAMALLAHMRSVVTRDPRAAMRGLDGVLAAAPRCGTAAVLKALTLCWLGEAEEAVVVAADAEGMPALGPELAWRGQVAALAHYAAGRYGEAVRRSRELVALGPGLAGTLRVLAASLAVLGRLDEAQQAGARLLAIDPAFRIGRWRQGSLLPAEWQASMSQRLRLAGLPA